MIQILKRKKSQKKWSLNRRVAIELHGQNRSIRYVIDSLAYAYLHNLFDQIILYGKFDETG